MDIAALIVSIVAIIVACVSIYFAKQQAAAANTQAEASKVQADAAKTQADASTIQATAATEALKQAASWRAEEERRAEPQFRVTVAPILDFLEAEKWDGTDRAPWREAPLRRVDVVAKNTSSRDATINHVGIKDVLIGSVKHDLEIYDPVNGRRIKFPHRLASEDLIEFSVLGSEFFALLGNGLPTQSEFAVFVAKSTFFADGPEVECWDSPPFRVWLPSSRLDQ